VQLPGKATETAYFNTATLKTKPKGFYVPKVNPENLFLNAQQMKMKLWINSSSYTSEVSEG